MSFNFSPAAKISLGLVFLMVSVLVVAETLGFVPDRREGGLAARKSFSESLAIQASIAAGSGDYDTLLSTFKIIKDRNPDLISAALRRLDGEVLAVSGNHKAHWRGAYPGRSTATHVHVPIYSGEGEWGALEIVYKPLIGNRLLPWSISSFFSLLVIAVIFGFVAFWYFMRRVLGELDPQAVIPARVKAAFDTLAEGVLILNEEHQIVLANSAFTRKAGLNSTELIGAKASSLPWEDDFCDAQETPWEKCVNLQCAQTAQPMRLQKPGERLLTFMVNATPIHGDDRSARGVLVTFDDVTDLELRHQEQKRTLEELNKTRVELQNRAVELETLASRDPLTGCNNRRAFIAKFNKAFEESLEFNKPLSCVMLDIDFFKSVNDKYGHSVGDEVIRYIADTLKTQSRSRDFVGRLGGEEFCVVLPDTDFKESCDAAERMRLSISRGNPSVSVRELKVTTSFGVAALDADVEDHSTLLNRADEALYGSKRAGRNQVQLWNAAGVYNDDRSDDVEANAPSAADAEASPEVRELEKRVVQLQQLVELQKLQETDSQDTDEVTKLPGRNTFLRSVAERLVDLQSHDGYAAVVSVDIDSFKRVNEALGTSTGDQLLNRVAEALSLALAQTPPSQAEEEIGVPLLARIANDEFALFMGGQQDSQRLKSRIKKIFQRLPETIEIEGRDLFLTYSAGISIYPSDSDAPRTLLENASAARGHAKRQHGRNTVRFFQTDMTASTNRGLWLETQLHRALTEGEFSLHYQPIIHLASGAIERMEALVRWEHPVAGLISPADFVPIAESTGFIRNIGAWILTEACTQAVRWRAEGVDGVTVSVNLSKVQFRQQDFVLMIGETLRQTELEPQGLSLEITESTLLDDINQAVGIISELRELGIKFALDDFGTGYSSLSALKTLPVDSVKIDRSFIGDGLPSKQDQIILQAVIAIAHELGKNVVAEGVTSDEQRQLLHRLACDYIQGYIVSKPLTAHDATTVLLENRRATLDTNVPKPKPRNPRQRSKSKKDRKDAAGGKQNAA